MPEPGAGLGHALAWLIPLLPLAAAGAIAVSCIAGWNRGESGERLTSRLALAGSGSALLLMLTLDLMALWQGAPGTLGWGHWFASGQVAIPLSLTLDPLGLMMGSLVALIAFLTQRFSVAYMHRETGFQRFFMILSLFNGAMLLIVLAGNAALVFVGWELAGVSSYLLIGYAYDRRTATGNAVRAFVTNRFGDAGFILALALGFAWLGGVDWHSLNQDSHGLASIDAGLLVLGFMLAALAKSAALPFSAWIARALEGPTPSSAVFYGALMVHTGVYLMIRLAPLLEQSPYLMALLAVLGLLTAGYGWLVGLTQTDVKSAFIYATTGQVGLMLLWCGLGWFELATAHLLLHAAWRAYQFLHAPSFLQLTHRPARPVPAWLRKRPGLYTASLQRGWLDPVADWALVRPTQAMAQDTQDFDEQVVNRLVGLPRQINALSALDPAESGGRADAGIARGVGLAGKLMETLADLLHWFEEQLVLKGGGEGLTRVMRRIGHRLLHIEHLLGQPRYLLLLILATLAVIL